MSAAPRRTRQNATMDPAAENRPSAATGSLMQHQGMLEPSDRFLRWPDVQRLTSLSRTTAWTLRQQGKFPEPVVLSAKRKAWRSSEIARWMSEREPSVVGAA
jgi:prophage regulatory protein